MKLSTLRVINTISTRSLNTIAWEHESRDMDDFSRSSTLLLTFDGQDSCTVSSDSEGVTANGTGKFVSKVIKTAGVTKIGMLFILSTPSTMAM